MFSHIFRNVFHVAVEKWSKTYGSNCMANCDIIIMQFKL